MDIETLKVSSDSIPKMVAGAIAGILRNNKQADLVAVGAGAVNQTVKSIAIARGYVITNGIELVCSPSFCTIDVDGEDKTAIRFLVETR